MKIILHLGAHCTDEGKLAHSLARNRGDFLARGVAVPPPANYRVLLREAIHALDNGPPAEDAGDILIDSILGDDHAERMILSNDNFLGVPHMSIENGQFYPTVEARLADLRQLFPDVEFELFLAVRDPGTFIPAVQAASNGMTLEQVLNGTDPGQLRWSGMIRRMRDIAPDMPVTLWCNEDSPLIYGEIIRAMAGLPEGHKIRGAFELLSEIMTREGMQRFRAYFAANPTMTEPQKRKAIIVFLKKYAIVDGFEDDIPLPPWPDEIFEYLTDAYEEDIDSLEGTEGVRILRP